VDHLQGVEVTIGCPTDADRKERETLLEAARRAGIREGLSEHPFSHVREEPLLAAKTLPTFTDLAAGRYLVIDIGGGSTDIAIVDYPGLGQPISAIAAAGARFCG
jgi:actin-like ATPase involved in cell morphogenesis